MTTLQNNNNDNNLVNLRKIKDAKYKLVILLLLILAYIIFPYYQNIKNDLERTKQTLVLKKQNLEKIKEEKKILNEIRDKILYIEKNKRKIIECINKQSGDFNSYGLKLINSDLFLIKSYFMFKKFSKSSKMDYDQKRVLSDIFFYLEGRGQIDVISFGNVNKILKSNQVYILPITLGITFKNYNQLLSFLDVIENKINTSRDLFIIKNLNYDILKYNEPQNVTLNVEVLFYK